MMFVRSTRKLMGSLQWWMWGIRIERRLHVKGSGKCIIWLRFWWIRPVLLIGICFCMIRGNPLHWSRRNWMLFIGSIKKLIRRNRKWKILRLSRLSDVPKCIYWKIMIKLLIFHDFFFIFLYLNLFPLSIYIFKKGKQWKTQFYTFLLT